MQTITIYTLIYEQDGFITEANFRTEAQARDFITQYGVAPIKLYMQRLLGEMTDIPLS